MSDTYQGDDDTNLAPADDEDLAPPADDSDLPADEGDTGDDTGGAGEEDDQPPARTESRAAREIRQLRERSQLAEQRAEQLAREIEAVRRPQVDPEAEERAFRARIAELPYDQQLLAVRDRERQVVGQQFQGIELRIAQSEDRASFSDLKRENPVAARHGEEVERRFREYQAKGNFVSREIILKNLLGEIALQRGPAAARRSGERGQQRIAGERGRGAARRGDAAAPGGRRDDMSPEAVEARLRTAFANGATLADI